MGSCINTQVKRLLSLLLIDNLQLIVRKDKAKYGCRAEADSYLNLLDA